MDETIKRLLSPEYLAVVDPGPLGGLGAVFYGALAVAFVLGTALSLRALLSLAHPQEKRRIVHALAWLGLCLCAAGLATLVGRVLGWPGWSARIWPLAFLFLSFTTLAIYAVRNATTPRWLGTQLRILALAPLRNERTPEPKWPRLSLALGLVHLGGIALLTIQWYGLSPWLVPVLAALVLLPQGPLVLRLRLPNMAALTPLLAAYAAVLAALAYERLGITIIGWQGLEFPNPYVSLFYTDGIILAAVVYAWLCQTAYTVRAINHARSGWRALAIALLVAVSAWCILVYIGKRTHGATASDPYAYAQMAVDLAERGTFVHRFDLFQDVSALGIAWAPFQPVGYHVPSNALGDSASVWATGASVLLAAGYLLIGESGLYLVTPLVALGSLAASWLLVQEVLRDEPSSARHPVGAITVALLATSPEQVDRLLVPMADAAAQLFTVATLLFALRGYRLLLVDDRRAQLSLFMAGLFLGWAYWVRHTQLLLALPIGLAIALALQHRQPSWRQVLKALLVVFGTALVAASPDILYRWRTFGSPWAVESTELASMKIGFVGHVSRQLLRELLAAGEWGYLFPLALYGTLHLARRRRHATAVLGTAMVAIVLLHLTYRYLRIRDLASIFPLLSFFTAYGAIMLARQARVLVDQSGSQKRMGPALLGAGGIGWIVLALTLSRWAVADRVWEPGWASFGYMDAEMRAAMDQIAELTPPDAVVAASLNAGAIALYSDRDPVRPYDSWSMADWDVFVGAMRQLGRQIYLLDDGRQMSQFIDRTRTRYALVQVKALSVPVYGEPGRTTGWLYSLEGH